MPRIAVENCTVADAYLRLLGARGIELFIGNAGTDFAPLIEAFASLNAKGVAVPRPVTVPHENVAIHMALGHWMISGKPQAVMVHVNVGMANALCGLLNAYQAEIPVLFTSGRTPWTEGGVDGSRNLPIHWTQEMPDQNGMARQAVKWDYELRHPAQLEGLVDRALAIALAAPAGPVYLALPREVLAMKLDRFEYFDPARQAIPSATFPDIRALEQLCDWLLEASKPIIITSNTGLQAGGMESLARFCDIAAIGVVQTNVRCAALPSAHPMHAGYDATPFLADADLIIVLDCPVPWIPDRVRPRDGARVVHIGTDPLHQRLPLRSFESDLAIASLGHVALDLLSAMIELRTNAGHAGHLGARRNAIAAQHVKSTAALDKHRQERKARRPIDPDWLAFCVSEACGPEAILLRESPRISPAHFHLTRSTSYLSAGAAGGLGWGLGAAVGAAIAAPDRLVVAIEGDGSYMFGTPVAAHYVALEQRAPFLTVIANNQRWNEVRAATRHLYPNGIAAGGNAPEPLTYFDPGLRLHRVVESAGGHGERIEDPAELPAALLRAIDIIKNDRRQVVLDVICGD
jgi:acetolactate synthase I/II/III large subunit